MTGATPTEPALPPAPRLVPMTGEHVTALMPHERDMFGTESWSRASYLAEISDPLRRYVACEDDDGALLGWGGAMVIADTAEILTIGVVPAARRRGLARLMLAHLLGEVAGRGAREVFLEVRTDNLAAITLYESDGFVRVGTRRGYYDGGRVDAITMRRAFGGIPCPDPKDPPQPEGGGSAT